MKNYFNTGDGFELQPVDIGHKEFICLVQPDTAFWALVKKDKLGRALVDSRLLREYQKKAKAFHDEMRNLRFNRKPSAVYLNATDRCNLNCAYCYIPKDLRLNGRHMPHKKLFKALGILKDYFISTLPKGQRPQVVFHGAEPLLNKIAIFSAIDEFRQYFHFGIQTNGMFLDDKSAAFLISRNVSIGLSLDGHIPEVADRLRRTWSGRGISRSVVEAIKRLKGYNNYSIICTVTKENAAYQVEMVEFLHELRAPICMLNPVRLTRPGARKHKPFDAKIAKYYLKALDRAYELYKKTNRKLVVANFANILIAILAPTARRLMCDISPCGAGRCFFAISSEGDLFPCGEFIGIKRFRGGNIFKHDIGKVLKREPFESVMLRQIEDIEPCGTCAIRHFCGSPCPAEAYELNGSIQTRGAFCALYEEQARYAFRLIADHKENAYLWDGWDKGVSLELNLTAL